MERTEVEARLRKCELSLNQVGVIATSASTWMGIDVSWQRLAKRDGGITKRNGVYGRYIYTYRNQEITFDEAVDEIMKPRALREALIEATTLIECSMCGKVVVGQEAMNPYLQEKPWGYVYWRVIKNKPVYLNLCPDCLQAVRDGQYRQPTQR